MNILDAIIKKKKEETAERKKYFPEDWLIQQPYFKREGFSLANNLAADQPGIIAEFKRRSPSKGFINEHADVDVITKGYTEAGAAGLSVLTDEYFFGGNSMDLISARINRIPILRKDFIIEPYQVLETKAMGADVLLLIAACLSPEKVKTLAQYAVSLGLEVLLELHDEEELKHICAETVMIGINNRDLKDFTVNINASSDLGKKIPADKIKISESGISDPDTIERFREEGFKGFLIGETFMRTADPAKALSNFIKKLK